MAVSKPVKGSKTVIIVGAGIFGSSTALHLATRHPDWNITIVDPTQEANAQSASHDISKIVRGDYTHEALIRIVIQAMNKWHDDPLYRRFFHKVGMLRAQPDNFSKKSLAAYDALGVPTKSRWMTVEEVREAWPPFQTADFGHLREVMYNPDYGFVEAAPALQAVRNEAVGKGANLIVGEATRLKLDDVGNCTGVILAGGQELRGTVLLCTGARTASLLANTAPELDPGDKILATGALSFAIRVEGERKERFKDIPVLKSRVEGVMGESMSLLGNVLKFNVDTCFTRNGLHEASGHKMSLVPSDESLTVWGDGESLPQSLKERAHSTLKGLYGDEVKGKTIEQFRLCWDAHTKDHNFIISGHPRCGNLFVATGGSFHAWKFFPVIGEYVAQLMDGTLEEVYRDMWAWDRSDNGPRGNVTYDLDGDLGAMM